MLFPAAPCAKKVMPDYKSVDKTDKKVYICVAKSIVMKTKKAYTGILLFAILCFSFPLFSQDTDSHSLFDFEEEAPATDFSLDAGTSFTSFSGSGGMFTNSIAPRLNWDAGKNFHLEVGTIFSTSRFTGFPAAMPYNSTVFQPGSTIQSGEGQLFSSTVYAMGSYRVSPRLTVHGATWVERNSYDMNNMPEMNPHAVSTNPHGMMMGFDYRISENLRFGAEVNFSTGHNPYNPAYMHQSPFGGFYNPSPFHRRDRW